MNTSGFSNTFIGAQAGEGNTTNISNVYIGAGTPIQNDGSENIFVGKQAGPIASGTTSTVLLGYRAGRNLTTGSNNIYLGSTGEPTGIENNALRIGNDGTGVAQQNKAYIAGIKEQTITTGNPVWIDANGMLAGTLVATRSDSGATVATLVAKVVRATLPTSV